MEGRKRVSNDPDLLFFATDRLEAKAFATHPLTRASIERLEQVVKAAHAFYRDVDPRVVGM